MSAVFKNIIRDHRLSHKLIPVFTVAPELELACSRIADFVGEHFRGESGPLVKEMFECALSGYKRTRRAGNEHIAFMQGLFQQSQLLYARRYVARQADKVEVWSPMIEPIPVFETRYNGFEIETIDERCPEHITERTAAFQLASRVLHGETFRMYFEDYDVAHRFHHSEVVGG